MDAIIGFIAALTLSLLSMAGFAKYADMGVRNIQTSAIASQGRVIDQAAAQYVQDNAAALAASVPVGGAATTITVNTLQAAGYLPGGFSANTAFGQTWQVQVSQPTAGRLQTIVMTTGGNPITNTAQLAGIAAQIGAEGGFVPYANQGGNSAMNPSNANGAFGAWQVNLGASGFTNAGSGHVANLLAFTSQQANANYLYRVSVPGHPELNAMQTDLSMQDAGGTAHSIAGVNNVTAAGTVTAGKLVSNGDVTAAGNATVNGNVNAAGGRVVAWNNPTEGGVVTIQGANGVNMYVENLNGTLRLVNSPWNAQLFSVDQSGNVISAGNTTANGISQAQGFTLSNGALFDSDQGGSLELGGNNTKAGSGTPYIDFHYAGLTQDFNTRLISDMPNKLSLYAANGAGALNVQGTVQVANMATPNSACSPNGIAAANADGSGQWLNCIYGVWKPIGGNLLRYGYFTASYGTYIPTPTCSAGATPMIVVTPANFSVDPTTTVNYGAWGSGPWWVYILDGNSSPLWGATATVGTYCGY